MVLNRMAKGAKEIDIAATLEHIRDQRSRTVATKQQFEFVLMAVAEEVCLLASEYWNKTESWVSVIVCHHDEISNLP